MANEHVQEFTDDNFEQEVLQADQPVLVDFWAEWCMPCKMLAPTIDEVAGAFSGKAKVGKVDTDSNRNVSMKYGINAIPTVLLFKGGEVTKKFVGLTNRNDLEAAINEAIA
ncbi:MAG: thioredoxin [Phycisphaeraceae bacterium]|nr:thioredoxin [Phycisphaeraceae bacterium]MCB9847828.1 thioredoxin [Phycisphaeraceae bacterium]